MKRKTKDEFYNYLMNLADMIHADTWKTGLGAATTGIHTDHDVAKCLENLMGDIIREYKNIHGTPEPITVEIENFIDPMNTSHIKAYLYMQTHGKWPEGFVERHNIEFNNSSWKQAVDTKLADFWIKKHLRTAEYDNVIKSQ